MGCSSSTLPVSDSTKSKGGSALGADMYSLTLNACSPHLRMDHSEAVTKRNIEGKAYKYDVSYCYCSQKGYYPNAMGKANQDSYMICENILGDKSCHVFGVFDGHGETGDHCSHFAAEQFAYVFATDLKSNGGTDALDGNKMEAVYKHSYIKVNKMLHKSKIDDTLSGTTGVTIALKGDVLYIANVGDSRAIIASDVDGTPKFSALSNDQTPFRKDERDRLRTKGAQIMTLDQIEGNEALHDNWGAETGEEIDEVGDPPRVWDATLERPGCAFTRSIGDSVAEKVGVYAEPELLTWKLSPSDRFAIVASDGVFEFLTSQAVVDMMAQFKDPLEAAKHIVAEAYRLWLVYDDRTDDITMIVVVFDNFEVKDDNAATANRLANVRSGTHQADSKPVRTVISKAKRKGISESWSADEKVDFDFAANAVPKTPEELQRISEMVSTNFMFQHLTKEQKDQIFTVMKRREVKEGEMIIREGDPGDELYVIDNGVFSAQKKDEEGIDRVVYTYTTVGAVFGELSLMYGKPRAASVVANTDGRLWSIGRLAFRASLMKKQQAGLMKLLRAIPVLSTLTIPQLQRICERTTEVAYKDGEVIVEADTDIPWALCAILSGTVQTKGKTAGKKEKTRAEGAYIGEPEVGSVVSQATACGKVKVALVPMNVFVDVVGQNAKKLLKDQCTKTNRGAPLTRKASVFSSPEVFASMSSSKAKQQNVVDCPIMLIGGEFGYIGNASDKEGKRISIKVIAKQQAMDQKMDTKLLNERLFLFAIGGTCPFLPNVMSTTHNSRIATIVYRDEFVCDLSMCMSAGIDDSTKMYYGACLCSAIEFLHQFGLMHRYLNTESVYITAQGIPKIVDLRHAKKMEGSKVFTVCGDPLYFAPEIITQQGYDYACDLWAFGCLLYELFEESTPFGNATTEETALFKAITGHQQGALKFTDKTSPEAQKLIDAILHPKATSRAGYNSYSEIKESSFFQTITWINLQECVAQYVSVIIKPAPLDLSNSTLFGPENEDNLPDCLSKTLDEF